jgi:hypothetical protein
VTTFRNRRPGPPSGPAGDTVYQRPTERRRRTSTASQSRHRGPCRRSPPAPLGHGGDSAPVEAPWRATAVIVRFEGEDLLPVALGAGDHRGVGVPHRQVGMATGELPDVATSSRPQPIANARDSRSARIASIASERRRSIRFVTLARRRSGAFLSGVRERPYRRTVGMSGSGAVAQPERPTRPGRWEVRLQPLRCWRQPSDRDTVLRIT